MRDAPGWFARAGSLDIAFLRVYHQHPPHLTIPGLFSYRHRCSDSSCPPTLRGTSRFCSAKSSEIFGVSTAIEIKKKSSLERIQVLFYVISERIKVINLSIIEMVTNNDFFQNMNCVLKFYVYEKQKIFRKYLLYFTWNV